MAQSAASGRTAHVDALSRPGYQFAWWLEYDDHLREQYQEFIASLGPDKASNRKALEQWLADEGFADVSVDDIVEALKAPAPPLTAEELIDVRDFAWSLTVSAVLRRQCAEKLKEMAAVDPQGYAGNLEGYWSRLQAMSADLVNSIKRPAARSTVDPSLEIPASMADPPLLVRSLRCSQTVSDWWNTYGYVVVTVHDAVRRLQGSANPIEQPSTPSKISLRSTGDQAVDVLLFGVDATHGAVSETISTSATSEATSEKIYQQLLGVRVATAKPVGTITVSAAGTTLATIDTSTTRSAGEAPLNWLAVESSLKLRRASTAMTAFLVGQSEQGDKVQDGQEVCSLTPEKEVEAKAKWLEITSVYVGSLPSSESFELWAPHSRNGAVLKNDTLGEPQSKDAPVVILGPPEARLLIGEHAILESVLDEDGTVLKIAFPTADTQSFSGTVQLLQTDTPRGDRQLTGKYLLGRLTSAKASYLDKAFGICGDFTLDAMVAPVKSKDTSPSGWDVIDKIAKLVPLTTLVPSLVVSLAAIHYLVIRKRRASNRRVAFDREIEMTEEMARSLGEQRAHLQGVAEAEATVAIAELLQEANNRHADIQARINQFPVERYGRGDSTLADLQKARDKVVREKARLEAMLKERQKEKEKEDESAASDTESSTSEG